MAKLTPAFTYTPAEELALWKEARVHASQNKSYTIRGKTYTRQDLKLINEMIQQLAAEIGASTRSTIVTSRRARR